MSTILDKVDVAQCGLPLLPLVLWRTPPALEMILAQEGISHTVAESGPAAVARAGRFVLFDSRREPAQRVAAWLARDQVSFDIDRLRRGWSFDPFAALLDTRAQTCRWTIGGHVVSERVNRHDRGPIRRRLISALRDWLIAAGGVWARLGAFPYPYTSAFNFRVDLDEPAEADYFRFARARRPIDDCTTHFVSTAAYSRLHRVMDDLRGRDTQSHGHHHVVYRGEEANRKNLERADALLRADRIEPTGFAAPEGRWNREIDSVIESLGYGYSSEFQVGYDDRPFFAWRGDRFSRVLQVPIHPICEGLFLNAGASDGRVVADHLASVVRARVESGEPAFVYGHPEGRLGRFPEIVDAVARAAAAVAPHLWRTTLGEFAAWWRWRADRRWTLHRRGSVLILQFENGCTRHTPSLEIDRGSQFASLPIRDPDQAIMNEADLVTHRVRDLHPRYRLDRAVPAAFQFQPRLLVRAGMRWAMDWETVTPIDELPERTPAERWKKRLRRARMRSGAISPGGES